MQNQQNEMNNSYNFDQQSPSSFRFQYQQYNLKQTQFNHHYQDNTYNNFKFINQKYQLTELFKTNQEEIQSFMFSNKYFYGIKYLFGLEGEKEEDFLEDIDSEIFNTSFYDNPNLVDLSKFFQDESSSSQQSQYKQLINELTNKLGEIQNKAFTGISVHKTVGKAFYEHFQNYLKLRNLSNFFDNFYISFEKFILESNKVKKNGLSLILMIYQFWMRMFREFVREIWRHSQKYSLGLFKKNKNTQMKFEEHSNKSSTSSSQQGEKIQKDRRKPWSKNQIDILQKIIDSNATFNSIRLQKLAQEFDRSSNSISSKIQKIIKLKKINDFDQNNTLNEDTIEKKIQFTLRLHPQGLSKDDVIKKMNQLYEMGLQQNWKKSVCQILSSKKNIQKIKGTFRLLNPSRYYQHEVCETLKDKIIQTLLQFQNHQADLKSLAQKYIQLYYKKDDIHLQDKQKLKSIEINLSKALNRYQIFQKTNEKIIYKLIQNKQEYSSQMQVENYIN